MDNRIEKYQKKIEDKLLWIFETFVRDSKLKEAMSYSTLNGGKRIRPLLTIASGLLIDVDLEVLLTVGCAIELMHCYSLIHDDLPMMDNDDLRRGLPTCHKKYGEDLAILAGDALQSLSFEVLSSNLVGVDLKAQLQIINLLANCSGADGMAGGQTIDLLSNGKILLYEELREMHLMKTGALIKAAMMSGYLSGANLKTSEKQYRQLNNLAIKVGLLFQIIDDIIDMTSSTEELGKTANKDHDFNKATYVTIFGLPKSRDLATSLYNEIKTELLSEFVNCEFFIFLLELIYKRNN